MRAHFIHLLSSAAFANSGAQAMAAYKRSPDPGPLAATVEYLNSQAALVDDDVLSKRAPDLAAMVEYWDKTDAIIEGWDAVKACGKTYLPKFADEEDSEYNVRLSLSKFTNIYRDIVESLASKPFEQEVTFQSGEAVSNPPDAIKDFIEDVDGSGNNLTVFLSLTMFNGINSAIDWIFVDYPTVNPQEIRTQADQKAAGIKTFWSHVLGRNMLEIRTEMLNGKNMLSYVRWLEPGINAEDRIRIFERLPNGQIVWFLYEKQPLTNDQKRKWLLIDKGVLSIDEIPLVPFITGRRDGASWKIYPPMRDAADLQIQLYRDESALNFIKTMSGYPMLAANGLKPQMAADGKTPLKVKVGPSRVLWSAPNGQGQAGKWEYVEPSAANMEFLEKNINRTIQDLRELGRQPLTAQSGNLTVITTAVAAGKARSAVAAWTLNLKDAGENALEITAKFMNISDYEPELNVYNEFDNFTDGGADLTALQAARNARDISGKTFTSELKRRKVLSPEYNYEADTLLLLAEGPPDLAEDAPTDKKPKVTK